MSKKSNQSTLFQPWQLITQSWNWLKNSLLDDVYKKATEGEIQSLRSELNDLKYRVTNVHQELNSVEGLKRNVAMLELQIKFFETQLETQLPKTIISLLQNNLSGVRQAVINIVNESLENQTNKIANLSPENKEELEKAIAQKAKLEASLELFNDSFEELTEATTRLKFCKDASDWLDKEKDKLALEVTNLVFNRDPKLFINYENESNEVDSKKQSFCEDISQYLGSISRSLSVGSEPILINLMNQGIITPRLSPLAYFMAFEFIINNKVSEELPYQAVLELKDYLNHYLIRYFQGQL